MVSTITTDTHLHHQSPTTLSPHHPITLHIPPQHQSSLLLHTHTSPLSYLPRHRLLPSLFITILKHPSTQFLPLHFPPTPPSPPLPLPPLTSPSPHATYTSPPLLPPTPHSIPPSPHSTSPSPPLTPSTPPLQCPPRWHDREGPAFAPLRCLYCASVYCPWGRSA